MMKGNSEKGLPLTVNVWPDSLQSRQRACPGKRFNFIRFIELFSVSFIELIIFNLQKVIRSWNGTTIQW